MYLLTTYLVSQDEKQLLAYIDYVISTTVWPLSIYMHTGRYIALQQTPYFTSAWQENGGPPLNPPRRPLRGQNYSERVLNNLGCYVLGSDVFDVCVSPRESKVHCLEL